MDCHDIDELISQQLDGRLSAEAREELDRHLAGCPGCARAAEEARKAEDLLRALDEVEPSLDFDEGLAGRIERARKPGFAALLFGRLASVAAGVAIGVALAGAFHFLRPRALPDPAAPPAVSTGNSDGRYVPELVEVLDNPRLKEGLNTFEAWSSDVHHFSGEEPRVARDVLYREIEDLGIVDKLSDLRQASARLGTRAPEANRLLSDITGGVEEIVNRVNHLPSSGDVDPAEVSDLRLRSEHTLRRIEAFRSLYRAEFAPPSVTTLEQGGDVSADLGSRLDPVQVYVNGVRLWTKGESGRAFRVFRHIDRKAPAAPVASRARDMMIWIYADAGRFGRDTKSAEHVEKMLRQAQIATPATYARLQDLVRTLEQKRMAGPSVQQLRQIKVRLGGTQFTSLFLVGLTVSQFLGTVTVLKRLRINGRPVDLAGLDQKEVLAALGGLPSPWTVGSRTYRYEASRERRLVSGVIFRRGSNPWTCPPGLARTFEALDEARPGLFDPAAMRVISFEGEGPAPGTKEKK